MNPFQRHNIKHLSASSLGLFRAQPALWVLKYLANFREDAGPAAWRGSAVEGGFTRWLYEPNCTENDCLGTAHATFMASCQGELSDEIDAERANIGPMLTQAITTFPNRTTPIAKQLRVETWLDGLAIPLVGYVDILHDGLLTDLKTTKACPSEAKPDHKRQVALYVHARGMKEDAQLFYVTGKKSALYKVGRDEVPALVESVRRDALALQRFLGRVDSGPDALSILPADFDHFMWSDAAKGFALSL